MYITLFSIWTIVLINTNKILIFLVIESIKNNLTPKSVTTYLITYLITYLSTMLKCCSLILITFFYVKYFENMKYEVEVIYIIINILILIVLFWDITIIMLLLFLGILVIIFPPRTGKYYKSFKYFRYINGLRKNGIKVNRKIIFIIITKIFFLMLICFILSLLTSNCLKISVLLSMICYTTVVIRIFFRKNENDKILNIIQKLILYVVIVVLYIIINSRLNAEFEKIIAFLITMYFAWDRIFSISKEIKQVIREQSVLYYYEEDISLQELNEMYLSYKFICQNIEEDKLIIQIMIRCNLLLYKNLTTENFDMIRLELFKLCNLYHSAGYFLYTIFVRYINISFNWEMLQDNEYKKGLFRDIEEKDKQESYPVEAIIYYIEEMNDNNEFEKVKKAYFKYLAIFTKTLNIEVLEILRNTFNKLEDENMVGYLDKLIKNNLA